MSPLQTGVEFGAFGGLDYWIGLFVVLTVGHPFALIVHETAHAVAGRLSAGASAAVVVGTGPYRTVRLGDRFEVRLSTGGLSPLTLLPGWATYEGGSWGRWDHAITSIAGPLATIGVILAVVVAFPALPTVARDGAGIFLFMLTVQALSTLVPVEYPSWMGAYAGQPSDGLRVVRAIRGEDVGT